MSYIKLDGDYIAPINITEDILRKALSSKTDAEIEKILAYAKEDNWLLFINERIESARVCRLFQPFDKFWINSLYFDEYPEKEYFNKTRRLEIYLVRTEQHVEELVLTILKDLVRRKEQL